LVEQRTFNPKRPGSSPGDGTQKPWKSLFMCFQSVGKLVKMSRICPEVWLELRP
jgi:hypothetical protein